jgi:tRNA-specific 2-thiouridylase
MSEKLSIAVGMSGGVDSTMAAWLLKQQGHEVIGLTMQIWDGAIAMPDEGRSGCYGPGECRDLAAAQAIAEKIGIRHVVISLAGDYNTCVLDYFRGEYRHGRTPNPCVVCNQKMKFGLLLEKAREQGVQFDIFATGHYAQVRLDAARGLYRLLQGADTRKDQSYFLARLTQEQLRQTRFPLGAMMKADVIRQARDAGFTEAAAREESQDFIESEDYTPLFTDADHRPGPVVDSAGHVLGQHRGIIHYTIGQREGLGIAAAERMYVKELRPETNTVVLGRRDEVMQTACAIEDASWISGTPPEDGISCRVRLRYRHPGVQAVLHCSPDGRWRADFAEPQFGVAPGQAAVCYDNNEVLGGGWIGNVAP